MEIQQTSYGVSADVPSLASNYVHDSSNGNNILQPRSSNPQYESAQAEDGSLVKANTSAPQENINVLLDRRGAIRPGRGRSLWDKIPAAQVEWFYRRMKASQGYAKYREGQAKESRRPLKANERRWPDHEEILFIKALLTHPPVGRQKKSIRGAKKAQLGRNELIAHSLNEWLGLSHIPDAERPADEIKVTRKQVSSHVQVEKKFFVETGDRIVLNFFPPEKKSANSQYDPIRRSSNFRHSRCLRGDGLFQPDRNTTMVSAPALPQPFNLLPSQTFTKGKSSLEPYEFHMSIEESRPEARRVGQRRILHTFTKSQKHGPLQEMHLEDLPNWQQSLPQLAQMHSQGNLDCEVLLADCSLAPMAQSPYEDTTLTIESFLSSEENLDQSYQWKCRTQYFEMGVPQKPFTHKIEHYQHHGQWIHSLTFSSQYWSEQFVELNRIHRGAVRTAEYAAQSEETHGNSSSGSPKAIMRHAKEKMRNHIGRISAVQEIYADSQRVMIIYWKFKLTSQGQDGVTTWQRLIPPALKPEPEYPLQDNFGVTVESDGTATYTNESFSQAYDQYGRSDLHTLSSIATAYDPFVYDQDALSALASLGASADGRAESFHATSNAPSMVGAESQQTIDYPVSATYALPTPDTASSFGGVQPYDPGMLDCSSQSFSQRTSVSQHQEVQTLQMVQHPYASPTSPTSYGADNSLTHYSRQQHQHHQQQQQQQQRQKQPPQYAGYEILFGGDMGYSMSPQYSQAHQQPMSGRAYMQQPQQQQQQQQQQHHYYGRGHEHTQALGGAQEPGQEGSGVMEEGFDQSFVMEERGGAAIPQLLPSVFEDVR